MTLTVMAGGLGAVGQMLRRELADELGEVVNIDLRDVRNPVDITAPGVIEHGLLRRADIVVLAVPESVAIAALWSLKSVLSTDALLVETLSVKTRFAAAVENSRPLFEVAGMNPMFGPSLDMTGRAVAIVPFTTGARTAWFSSLIAAHGAQVTELSPEAHDRVTAALQALPHVLVLAFARALTGCELALDSILRLAPPPASAVLALAARVASGNPQVYAEIQTANPFAQRARLSLGQAVAEVMDAASDANALGDLLAKVTADLGDFCPNLLLAAERLARQERPLEPLTGPRSSVHLL